MNVPLELETMCNGWYRYLNRMVDTSKLKTAPNSTLDMNSYCKCIVGESYNKKTIYFNKKKEKETFCQECKEFSQLISQDYHSLIMEDKTTKKKDEIGRYIYKFNETLSHFIRHFKQCHLKKEGI